MYTCAKCGSHDCSVGELRGTGGLASSMFNLQNTKFAFVACKQCGFTDFYLKTVAQLQKFLDLLSG